MATITIDGRTVETTDGATLLEVCRHNGAYVPSLCYLEGLPPYAGCRMCLVEIDGARGLQLSCSTKVTDGMVVRTHTEEARQAHKQVLSLILANHSDRCLTCHRRELCHPGDICLRDQVVTHRCITCPKNYRCELQATCEVVGMANYEPWEGEARSWYAMASHPPADEGNPFFEFDPKMCILCTRCVRACQDIRHTGAITLAGRGFSAHIAFGGGGPIHESNCDFCGACIDVCPTATLLDHPHKWVSKPDQWVNTVCPYCSVGCTIRLGVRQGQGIIVRPSSANPISFDQICVRGRYHYDALRERDRIARPLIRRGDVHAPLSWEEAIAQAAGALKAARDRHDPSAVGVLVSPLASNEEAYLAQKLARTLLHTGNVDSTAGPVARAVAGAVRDVFGTEVLPADLTRLAQADYVVVVADDLEASHPVAALRVKDAVARNFARCVVVAGRQGEVSDFAHAWVRPRAGGEVAALNALVAALATDPELRALRTSQGVQGLERLAAGDAPADAEAFSLLRAAALGDKAAVAVVFAPAPTATWRNDALARAALDLTILLAGPARAAEAFYYLPTEANVLGLRDMGATADLLPGAHPLADAVFRDDLAARWESPVPAEGLTVTQMVANARVGRLKALLVVGDNPALWLPGRTEVLDALRRLDALVVIDQLMTDTAAEAHLVLPDVDVYGKDGTFTSADRRVLRRMAAVAPQGDARPALATLAALAEALGGSPDAFPSDAARVMDEVASFLPPYAHARYPELLLHERESLPDGPAATTPVDLLPTPAAAADGLLLLTARTLYTSLESAALHRPDADKLGREAFVEMRPEDAARLGVADGQPVSVEANGAVLPMTAKVTADVPAGAAFIPLLYDGGAVMKLLPADGSDAHVRVRAAVPAG